jgi:polygalacturonase
MKMNFLTWLWLFSSALFFSVLPAAGKEFRVNDYGAHAGSTIIQTDAIQKTIDAAAQAGGGVITFQPGVYLTGSLFLKSGTTLKVDEGVDLRGVQQLSAYPLMPTRVAGIEMKWPAALINVYRQSNVVITGKGVIDGDGKFWWDSYWNLRKDYDGKGLRWAADYDAQRPRLIQIFDSHKVHVDGLMLKRSGFWTVHICYSDDITVEGVTIRNNIGGKGPSTDGIDIDSSTHVLVQHADIEVNDDALCLKAGRDADGLRVNRPTEHVVIRDSTVRVGAAGITIGSETSGGFHDIEAYNLRVLRPVPNGVLFKSARIRGGVTENIRIHDLVLKGVAIPIHINLNWNPNYSYANLPPGMTDVPEYWKVLTTQVSPEKGIPRFRNVHIWNIRATDAKEAIAVNAYKEAPLENFRFDHLDLQAGTAGSIENARDWSFADAKIQTADGSFVQVKNSENVKGLPGPITSAR